MAGQGLKPMNMKSARCLAALGTGASIGAVLAAVVVSVNVLPVLAAGVVLGLLMAFSEYVADEA